MRNLKIKMQRSKRQIKNQNEFDGAFLKGSLVRYLILRTFVVLVGLLGVGCQAADQGMIVATEWEKEIVFDGGKSVSLENVWAGINGEIEFVGVGYTDKKEKGRPMYVGRIGSGGEVVSRRVGVVPNHWYLRGMSIRLMNVTAVHETKPAELAMVGDFRKDKKRNEPEQPLHEIENVKLYNTPFKQAGYPYHDGLAGSIVIGENIYYCGGGRVFCTTLDNEVRWHRSIKEVGKKQMYAVTGMAVVEGDGIYTVGLFGESESKFGLKSPVDILISKFGFDGKPIAEKSFQSGVGTFNFPKISATESGVVVAYIDLDETNGQSNSAGASKKKKTSYRMAMLDVELKEKWNRRISEAKGMPMFEMTSDREHIFMAHPKDISGDLARKLKVYDLAGNEIAEAQVDTMMMTGQSQLFAVGDGGCVLAGQVYKLDRTIIAGAVKLKVVKADSVGGRKIGVYDSRSVAVAFVGTKEFKAMKDDVDRKVAKAKADGDAKLLERLEKMKVREQHRLHRQGFGTESVHIYLRGYYSERLTSLKKKLGVDAVLSKWDEEGLENYKSFKKVDITEQLVDMMEPNAKQRKSALAIRKHKPLSKDKLDKLNCCGGE